MDYLLSNYKLSACEILQSFAVSEYGLRHVREAKTKGQSKWLHRCIAAIEFCPILGLAATVIEFLSSKLFLSSKSSKSLNGRVSLMKTAPSPLISFSTELETEIFPYYENHEKTFDKARIHGRMHIARAVIFCEVMGNYLKNKGEIVDLEFARKVTGMHDSGREANGKDKWEKESADLLRKHLILKGMNEDKANEKSKIIIKKSSNNDSLEYTLFQSADCLDIMRPCTGNGGREGFKPEYLTFLNDALPGSDDFQFREALVEEAWEFIQLSEAQKHTQFNESLGFMKKLLNIIENNPDKFKILSLAL